MYATKIEFNQVPKKITMSVNAYHIHIYSEDKCVFKRTLETEWLDPLHMELVNALNEVEKIVRKITQ